MKYLKEIKEYSLMQQIYAILFSLANKLQIQGDNQFKNLTSRQFMAILAVLHLPEDETTLNNIARKLGTSKQNTNVLITNIEKKGYIITMPSVRDKRAINVKVTEKGKQIILECGKKGIEFFAKVFRDFTEAELELLWNLLKKLHGYDGEEHDGFEEDIDYKLEIKEDEQIKAIEEFAKLRNKI
ncbi:MarR family winged helix-turn-helix transcriptional regulator [Pseudobacteroides cellulosolvens]|uniref:Transcriptional regulator, MarR family n=1 Tax=Pseudobacteroides cellulosolvens ATCC 35603 = DSM 2933 TaxID=398512 RepID=A0A0L6JU95_9FIRM|nr:MarR family transcriptional regulator [Pseudobacteroides cellulosolvens]KNY29289.1 transcriptional regulator, MarR family [Pseudobacteroides cellulosolvens ATCC 35603 = DSM 2933]